MINKLFFLLEPFFVFLFERIIFVFFVFELMVTLFIKKYAFCQCILARGEQKIISGSIEKFSIGNKEVLSGVLDNKVFFLKGKSIGFSDVKYSHNGQWKNFYCYVVPKKEASRYWFLKNRLKKYHLQDSYPKLIIKGELNDLEDYFFLKENEQFFNINLSLSKKLKNLILKHIIEATWKKGVIHFSFKEGIILECTAPFFIAPEITKKYFIQSNMSKESLKVLLSFNIDNVTKDQKIIIQENKKFFFKSKLAKNVEIHFEGLINDLNLQYSIKYKNKEVFFEEKSSKKISLDHDYIFFEKKHAFFQNKDFFRVRVFYE